MARGFFVVAFIFLASSTSSFAQKPEIREQEICPGIIYLHKTVPKVPWSIHVLRIERNRPELQLITTLPGGEFLGLTKLTDQLQFIPPEYQPIGGVNGDFFSWRRGPYQGDPGNLQITYGELASAPRTNSPGVNPLGSAAFWIDAKNQPHIGSVTPQFEITWPDKTKTPFGLSEERDENEVVLYTHVAGLSTRTTNGVELVLERKSSNRDPLQIGEKYKAKIIKVGTFNTALFKDSLVLSIGPKALEKLPKLQTGEVLQLSTATIPDLKGSMTGLGGGPILVSDGKIQKCPKEPRHPRAAMGFNRDFYFFIVVDGRREGISDGMNFAELAKEMAAWKCTDAMNLDGGGSAMLWAGELKSQPSDNRERPNANSLFVVRREMNSKSSPSKSAALKK